MNSDNLNNGHYANDEIDLRQIAKSLKERSRFIFGFTGIVTLIAIAYIIYQGTLPLQYKLEASFLKPSDSSVLNLNKFQLLSETKDSIYTRFLNLVGSQSFQKSIFLEGDYVNKLNETNEPIEDVEAYVSGVINSTQLSIFENDSKVNANGNGIYLESTKIELPYILSIKGANPDVLSEYLNEVVSKANREVVLNTANLEKQKITNRLEQITLEKNMLLAKAKKDRLSQILRIKEGDAQKIRELNLQISALRIKAKEDRLSQILRIKEEDAQKIRELNLQISALRIKAKEDRLSQILRIKEEDAQKIRELNDLIERARFKAKEERMNDIETLTAAAKLAGSLGIIDNNLGQINEGNNDINLNIAINEDDDLPEWYLFGEKALLERVELLKSRTSDDPFIPELVSLNNQINEIQNNNLLKTLEGRDSDDPFIPELVSLNNQINEIQNNNLLKTLEGRDSNDPFIPELVSLNNQINEIKINNLLKTLEGRDSDDPFIPELVSLNNQINEIQNNNLLKTLEGRDSNDPFIPELVSLNNQINEIKINNLLKTLEGRDSDDPFIPELVSLNNQINEIQNNNLLKTLEGRDSDDPFIPELVSLNNQINEIKINNLLKTLEGRDSDDPFIPELVSLNNQINEIQNNNLLKTLEERQDDSPFIARISELDVETAKLKSITLDMTGIDAMQVQQYASAQSIPISSGRNMILIVLALIGGFVMSIILAGLLNLFKEEETDK